MLEDIILSNTSPEIVEAYKKLPARAKNEDFGLLEEEVCVLDTETTGLSFFECQLIEIACARMNGRNIIERFHTFVNPGMPIPQKIVELTGIHDEDVADAPPPKEAVAKLAEFVAGSPVLAHNAQFDRTFIERVQGGYRVSKHWIDTLALSRIALPRLSTHRLQDMAEAFGCASVTHRAMDDVDALAGMWRIMLCALTNLPAGLLVHLSTMHEDVEWAYRPIFTQLALENPNAAFSLIGARGQLLSQNEFKARPDAEDLVGTMCPPSVGDITSAFEPNGAVGKMYDNFEARPQQVEMAQMVREGIATSSICSIEAGTGVGKSVAYLLPLALYAKNNNITCGVATKTNALTDQLVSHELPELSKVLPGGVKYMCLKGFEHYPCLRRLSALSHASELPLKNIQATSQKSNRSVATIASDMLTAIAVTYAYACQSIEGDIDSLGIRWGSVPKSLLTTTSADCRRSKCPYYPSLCLLHGTRRRAASCDILVTNHSLLLRDIAADHNILPPVKNWVVDEAHSFETEARKQWALEVDAASTRAYFEMLGSSKTGLIGAMGIQAAKSDGATLIEGLLARASSAAAAAQIASADFFDNVRDLGALARSNGSYDSTTLWINDDVRLTNEWGDLCRSGDTFVDNLDKLQKALGDAHKACVNALENAGNELSEMQRKAFELKEAASIILSGDDDTYVYSAQLSRSQRYIGEEKLMAEKLNIGSELAERWYPDMHSIAYCSATITVGNTFEHFAHANGIDLLDKDKHKEAALESCFDFNENMKALVVRDMPDPYDPNYLEALEDLLFDVHVAMGGSVLTLFTNRRDMQAVYDALAPRLSDEGLELAIQGKSASGKRLAKRFVQEKQLSLMALKSFWEGFDAAGETLRCVVIPKLPFTSPDDPVSQERGRRDRQAWRNWNLPEAVLSVKQAAGRLIRTSADAGVLVLADARLVTKGYGKVFLRSLPTNNVELVDLDEVGQDLKHWNLRH